ncbi:MAG: 4Fe-4S dicluster domain-containing protein, partial [Proteobacteria bacterium]|nr:4Fe-4S dicluster domain-containing protein [Pseudomonadota bacterium]
GFIEQTKKEPGGIKIPADLPYSWIDVDENGCTLCRSCANVCPTHAFKFEEATNSLHFKHINCIGCKLCYSACPENVITISAELYLEKLSLDYLKVAEDEMVKCEKCGDPYIGRKALDKVETKIFALEALKSTFSGTRKYILRKCPDCRAIDAMNDVNQGWEP